MNSENQVWVPRGIFFSFFLISNKNETLIVDFNAESKQEVFSISLKIGNLEINLVLS